MQMPTRVVNQLVDFSAKSWLRKAVVHMIASRLNNKETAEQRKLFESLDRNKDGYITKKELKKGLRHKLSEKEI